MLRVKKRGDGMGGVRAYMVYVCVSTENLARRM